jgi:hAT family protein
MNRPKRKITEKDATNLNEQSKSKAKKKKQKRDYTKTPTSIKASERKHRKTTGNKSGYKTKNPSNKYIENRLSEFPNQSLDIKDQKLYCQACSKIFNLWKKFIVRQHIKCPTHTDKLQMWLQKKIEETETHPLLQDFEQKHNLQGIKSVPLETKMYRQTVCEVLLESQIPLAKLDRPAFRNLLQENRYDIGGRQGVMEYVDFIMKKEEMKIKAEIKDRDIGVIFDGAMRFTEAIVFILRYVKEVTDEKTKWEIMQKVAALHLIDSSIDGKQLAMIATDRLIKNFQISPSNIVSLMRDGCSLNNVCVRNLKAIFLCCDDISCCSHLLNRVLEYLDTPLIVKFTNKWFKLCAQSANFRFEFATFLNESVVRFSKKRWASRWECMAQLYKKWKQIIGLLGVTLYGEKITSQCVDFIKTNEATLLMELALQMDFGKIITETIYFLEGDGFLIIYAYDKLKFIEAHIKNLTNVKDQVNLKNTYAAASELCAKKNNRELEAKKLIQKTVNKMQPVLTYLQEQFTTLAPQMNLFKAAKLFSPLYVASRPLDTNDVDDLKVISYFTDDKVRSLKEEFAKYHTLAAQCATNFDPLTWWSNVSGDLPAWSAACRVIILYQPSSAAAERVFSMLRKGINENQLSSLEDYQTCSIMLGYNHRTS